MAGGILEAIRSRRVARYFAPAAVSRDTLVQVLEAGRWAPTGGNRRLHRFVAVQSSATINLIRAVAPGMLGHPTALIVICIDWEKVTRLGCKPHSHTLYIDVGTAAENMLLAAHGLGLGAGPVTSFSKAAASAILGLPETLTPELIVCLGYAAASPPAGPSLPAKPTRLEDLVIWGDP